jgi:hypothetical protein
MHVQRNVIRLGMVTVAVGAIALISSVPGWAQSIVPPIRLPETVESDDASPLPEPEQDRLPDGANEPDVIMPPAAISDDLERPTPELRPSDALIEAGESEQVPKPTTSQPEASLWQSEVRIGQTPTEPTPTETMPPNQSAPAETTIEVTDAELQQFTAMLTQLQAIESSAQAELLQVVQASGLSEERFGQLYQAQQNPNATLEPAATPEEQQSFDQAIAQFATIEQETRSQQNQVFESGLPPERFEQIFAAVQQDPDLRQQVQQMLRN